MSEFQYIAFRAIDAPVSKANLKFMREQSTRAEITPWAFDSQYTFGDFHGDRVEMLRRGYDSPVPAGLNKLTSAQKAFAEFYGIDKALLAAAAQGAPSPSARARVKESFDYWLESQPDQAKNLWLKRVVEDEAPAVRIEIMAAYRKSQKAPAWPTAKVDRTIEEILERAEQLRR